MLEHWRVLVCNKFSLYFSFVFVDFFVAAAPAALLLTVSVLPFWLECQHIHNSNDIQMYTHIYTQRRGPRIQSYNIKTFVSTPFHTLL